MILHLHGDYGLWSSDNWHMDINLEYLCKVEGKKEEVEVKPNVWKKRVIVSKNHVKRIFKFILKNAYPEQIVQVQTYLNAHSNTYGKKSSKTYSGGD